MYYIGIDVAINSHEVCFLDAEGNVLDGNFFNIKNNHSGFARFKQMLFRYHLSEDNALVGMEAAGHYWLALYSWLMEICYHPETQYAFGENLQRTLW